LSWLTRTLAAGVAETTLDLLHIPVVRQGLTLSVGGLDLEVSEACNGLPFLLARAVGGVGAAWGLRLGPRPRVALVAFAVTAGIVANPVRVARPLGLERHPRPLGRRVPRPLPHHPGGSSIVRPDGLATHLDRDRDPGPAVVRLVPPHRHEPGRAPRPALADRDIQRSGRTGVQPELHEQRANVRRPRLGGRGPGPRVMALPG